MLPCRVPHRVLSAPFPLQTLDLQARVDALTGQHAMSARGASAPQAEGVEGEVPSAPSPWEWDDTLEVQVTAEGVWNAIAFWFDAELSGGSSGGAGAAAEVPGDGAVVVSSYAQGRAGVAGCSSWEQAVQYVDAASVAKVRVFASSLRVRELLLLRAWCAYVWQMIPVCMCAECCPASPRASQGSG